MHSTLASEQAPYIEYRSNLQCFVPATATVPSFIHHRLKLPLSQVADLIQNLLIRLHEAAAALQQQVMWANETKALLNSLSWAIHPLVDCLEKLAIDDGRVATHAERRFRAYHGYFNIRPLQSMDALELACEDARISYWIFQQLSDIRMDEYEVLHLVNATRLRWEALLNVVIGNGGAVEQLSETGKYPDRPIAECPDPARRISSAFFRWFIAHYAFAMNCIHARYHVDLTIQLFEAARYDESALSVTRAAALLRGSSTSMMLGCTMPPKIYQDYIRPSMGLGFTGNDNPEWAAFASAKTQMIKTLGAVHIPVIIKALKDFFEAYLQDIEVHVGIAAKLVGNKASLATEEINAFAGEGGKIERSATADLRMLHYMRVKEFEFLQVYPIINKLFSKDH